MFTKKKKRSETATHLILGQHCRLDLLPVKSKFIHETFKAHHLVCQSLWHENCHVVNVEVPSKLNLNLENLAILI